MSPPPSAFLSHASEDKERFVLSFALRLREKGIDAWLDRWEIVPGDSLVNKIFEEGIKNADAFIVVLSSNSVSKPWVKEELDAGIVRKINKTCRLIPVVIDDCTVPEALNHLLWVKIADIVNYDSELDQIVNTIFGGSDKPPIGTAPAPAGITVADYIADLTKTDNLVFGALCRHYLEVGNRLVSIRGLKREFEDLGISDEEFNESLEVLAGRYHLEAERTMDGISRARLSSSSLERFIRSEVPEYDSIVTQIVSKIVNENVLSNSELQEATQVAMPIVNHIMDILDSRGLANVTKFLGGGQRITKISPELKRKLR